MESRNFIKAATQLIKDIEDNRLVESFRDGSGGGSNPRIKIQKEINRVFSTLQNPTLPSAYKLRDASVANGYQVNRVVQEGIDQFNFLG